MSEKSPAYIMVLKSQSYGKQTLQNFLDTIIYSNTCKKHIDTSIDRKEEKVNHDFSFLALCIFLRHTAHSSIHLNEVPSTEDI